MSLEMHCHSVYSVDARGTPEEIVDVAADRGISTLALTDHNSVGGLKRARTQADRRGIRFLPGVELDAIWVGRGYHFVGVGFDPDDQSLNDLARQNFSIYEHTFRLNLEQLPSLGHPDLETVLLDQLPGRYLTHSAPVLNQWFARDVMLQSGMIPDREAFGNLMAEARKRALADHGPDAFRQFPLLEQVLPIVHNASGLLVLAHVANYFPGDADAQLSLIRDLIDHGLDGFELYHPSNLGEPHFDRLVDGADALGCVVTGGSDCHDRSQTGGNSIGRSNVPDSLLSRIDEALSSRRREPNQ